MAKTGGWWRQRSRTYKIALIALVIYGLYGLAGYFGGSPWLRTTIVDTLHETTGREVQLERAVFNPYGLAVTLKDFAFFDPDGEVFVAFDRLHVDFQLSSLFRWSWHFDVFELEGPRVRVTRTADGGFNFDDLLALGDENSPSGDKESIPRVSIGRFTLDRGVFDYHDRSRGELRSLTLDELDFQVRDFYTRGDGTDGNNYSLALTSPDGGHFLWTGNLTVDPLTLDGKLELSGLELKPVVRFYEDLLRFSVPSGEIAIATDYTLDLGGDDIGYSLADGSVTLNDLRVRQPDLDEDTLAIPELAIEGIALDSTDTSLRAERLGLDQPSLLIRHLEDGVDLQSLVASGDNQADTKADDSQARETGEDEGTDTADSPWLFRLNTLALNQGRLRYRNPTLRSPGELELQPLNVTVNNIQWGGEGDFRYEGNTRLNGEGDIRVSGEGHLNPARGDLHLRAEAVALAPLEPWLRDGMNVTLTSGQVSTDLRADATKLTASPAITATGSFSGQSIELREDGDRPLFQLDAFNLAGIDFNLTERRLAANRVDLNGLELDSMIDEQGRGPGERLRVNEPAATSDDSDGGEDSPWRIRAGEIHVRNSHLAFADRSLNPDFTFGLYRLSADMRNLDTGGDKGAPVTLKADVDRHAPFSVRGRIRPSGPFVDLAITLESYEMESLTPYTGRYIGRTVESGQLAVDADMQLAETRLEAGTHLRAQDFYLGEEVKSEEAITAPVRLGLAVLRDRNGLIRLLVNASGDLSDPNVSVSGIIVQAITNVLVKAATSPFDMLANLAGGKDIDTIAFPAGEAEPDTRSREILEAIKQVLTQRPTLNMKLAGSWTREDRVALARADRIQAWGGEDWTSVEAAAESPAFRRHIRRAYRNTLEQDPDQLVDPAEGADAEARQAHKHRVAVQAFEALVRHNADRIADERLKKLASRRAAAARAWLVETGGIEGNRLSSQPQPLKGQAPITGVQVGLSSP